MKIKTVKVNNIEIGTGMPKICVPIVGKTVGEIIEQAEAVASENANSENGAVDIVEWRADYCKDLFENSEGNPKCIEEILSGTELILKKLVEILKETPVLFTIRSQDEGGNLDIKDESYTEINNNVAAMGIAKLIDFQMSAGGARAETVIETAHKNEVKVIVSYHDFFSTQEEELIVDRLRAMQHLGGDIIKVAFMPNSKEDVITLVSAGTKMKDKYANRPMIIISMGEIGKITRLTGEAFGSDVTFGTIGEFSAPGQIDIKTLREAIKITHDNL